MTELPFVNSRIETGPVKFGADWAGVFIRGDDAIGYAGAIQRVLAQLDLEVPQEWLLKEGNALIRLGELLDSCREKPKP